MSGALEALTARLLAEGGLLAGAAVAAPSGATAGLGDAAAGGDEGYALLVEAIREGELQHYGGGRVLRGDDADLALLAGDRLYALGLSELAERGDLESVAALARVIALCAQAHAEGQPADADAAWSAGVAAVAARAERS